MEFAPVGVPDQKPGEAENDLRKSGRYSDEILARFGFKNRR